MGPSCRQAARHFDGLHVHDKRAGAGPPFGGGDALHCLGSERVGSETVYRLRGEGNQPASPDEGGSFLDAGFCPSAHAGSSSLSSPAVLPVLRQTSQEWMSGSRSPSSTRSTSPSASLLRRSLTRR